MYLGLNYILCFLASFWLKKDIDLAPCCLLQAIPAWSMFLRATWIHLGPSGTLASPKISAFIGLAAKPTQLCRVFASHHLNPASFWSEHIPKMTQRSPVPVTLPGASWHNGDCVTFFSGELLLMAMQCSGEDLVFFWEKNMHPVPPPDGGLCRPVRAGWVISLPLFPGLASL